MIYVNQKKVTSNTIRICLIKAHTMVAVWVVFQASHGTKNPPLIPHNPPMPIGKMHTVLSYIHAFQRFKEWSSELFPYGIPFQGICNITYYV